MVEHTSPAPSKRVRAFKPKVRTGCTTCKIRRVKCDEARPECSRCKTTGRRCDGYEHKLPAADSTAGRTAVPSSMAIRTLVRPGPSWELPGSLSELRSFRYFRDRTASHLSGSVGSSFWSRLVLQAAHVQPAIRHAVVAVGSIHERFENGDRSIYSSNDDIAHGGFALRHYIMAIKSLTQSIDEGGRSAAIVALTACVLFTCFETLRGHYGSAVTHVNGGVKILSILHDAEAQQRGSTHTQVAAPTPCVPLDTLEVVLTRLHNYAAEMIGATLADFRRGTRNWEPGFRDDIPPAFSTIDEARNSLEYHVSVFTQAMQTSATLASDPAAMQKDASLRYADTLQRWKRAFDLFLDRSEATFDANERAAALVLRVRERALALSCRTEYEAQETSQMEWDKLVPSFRELVALADVAVEALNEALTPTLGRPIFSLGGGIIGPMFVVARQCRDPTIRRQAISIIRRTPQQEGMWEPTTVVRVCERLVEMEEAGLTTVRQPKDVPLTRRIFAIDPAFDLENRRGQITYYSPQGSCTEPIVW